ncbi:MAG TPA: AMP-binding protein, partial [Methyloceanibacter sp.]|nr:AMP-binding protein [Methyloceanibacter sp.]
MSDLDVSARGAGPAGEREPIRKRPGSYARAYLQNYDKLSRTFSWADARALLDGLPGGGLNIAYEAVDRHVLAGRGGKVALRCIGRDDRISNLTYAELFKETNRFANVLAAAGIGKGDCVFALLGRVPALYIAALGTLKNGSVFS